MKKIFNKNALFLFLLPVFFVFHGCAENFGFISVKDCLLLLATYVPVTLVVYLLLYWAYRNVAKAALLAFILLGFYLFFGAIYDFLKEYASPLHKYRILVPLFFVLVLCMIVYLKKTSNTFQRITFFLNLLFTVYLLFDIAGITWKFMHPVPDKFSVYHFTEANQYTSCETCENPDIYFLIFDEYSSSLSLQEHYGFHNDLDSFLLKRDFHIQTKGYSNYNYTPASIASMLNISYIKGIRPNTLFTIDDYGRSQKLIKNNEVIKFLSQRGYSIINCSAFDLAGSPSPVVQLFLPLNTRLITDKTLLSRMYRDVGWMASNIAWLGDYYFFRVMRVNQKLLKMTKELSAAKSNRPKFIYAHFYLPHDPFYFDSTGHLRSKKAMQEDGRFANRPSKAYLDYLMYSNTEIKNLIDTIRTNTGGKAVIMVMGDHGFREYIETNTMQSFQAMNAIYLPGKDYHLFYDSISSVNQFRVVFNTLFKQSIPLLKDSTVFLAGKE